MASVPTKFERSKPLNDASVVIDRNAPHTFKATKILLGDIDRLAFVKPGRHLTPTKLEKLSNAALTVPYCGADPRTIFEPT